MLRSLFKRKNRTFTYILLECQGCKELDTYHVRLFKQSHLKDYLKQGWVSQNCTCGKQTIDSWGNTKHKIVGLYKEKITLDKLAGLTLYQKDWHRGKQSQRYEAPKE